jgi:hypothetical protein
MSAKAASPMAASRKGAGAALIGSLVIHGILALGAGAFIVAQYIQPPAPKFVAPPAAKLKIPPQTRQHRMNLEAHAGLASKPTFKKRLVSLRPTAFALPEAPKISFENSLVPDPSTMASTMISGLTGSAGLGLGGSGGFGKGLSNFSFMGVKAHGQRVVLCFDVSSSVVNKAKSSNMPLLKIKEETNKLLSSLPSGAQFGLIQFVRNYKPFADALTPMTPANRDLAMQWIETEWNEGGQMNRGQAGVLSPEPNGVVFVLYAAFAMKPDVIFIISDGQFEQTYPKNQRIPNDLLEAKMKELMPEKLAKVVVHFIGFQMSPTDKKAWERIVRHSGGKLREIR